MLPSWLKLLNCFHFFFPAAVFWIKNILKTSLLNIELKFYFFLNLERKTLGSLDLTWYYAVSTGDEHATLCSLYLASLETVCIHIYCTSFLKSDVAWINCSRNRCSVSEATCKGRAGFRSVQKTVPAVCICLAVIEFRKKTTSVSIWSCKYEVVFKCKLEKWDMSHKVWSCLLWL